MTQKRDQMSRVASEAPHNFHRLLAGAGEVMVALGIAILLFLAWKLWWVNDLTARDQTTSADALRRSWESHPAATEEEAPQPPGIADPHHGETLGVLLVPRFGDDYARTVAEGTDQDVLNSTTLGIGHYAGNALPGQVGNFALAAHRSAYGGAFHDLDALRNGDALILETTRGWFVYRMTKRTVVDPSAIQYVAANPDDIRRPPSQRLITMTTCDPLYSTARRMIVQGKFEEWVPRSEGLPTSLSRASLTSPEDTP